MVSKSYVVNPNNRITTRRNSEENHNELVKCEKSNEKMQNNNENQKKMFDRYILQISNEMVKMKPKSMFYDEKTSSSSSDHFWNNRGIIRWNRGEFIDNFRCKINLQTFVKIVILIILLIFFGVILLSWLSSSPSSSSKPSRVESDSPQKSETSSSHHQQTSSSTQQFSSSSSQPPPPLWTEESIDNKLQKTAKFDTTSSSTITTQKITSFSSSSSASTTTTAANTISNFDDHTTEKSSYNADDDAALLTKKYVERINFYTTSNKNLYSVKVSPTLPSIRKHHPTSSSELPIQNYANENSCQSTSLPLCQGILSYDLTDPKLKWNLTNIEYQHFKHLLDSECSKRAGDFVCHMLEPECRPTRMKYLKPCRRICKGIFESCSHVIASSEVLTEFFDCNTYTDSHDQNVCEDITRFSKKCFDDEFQCNDYSCIPSKWRCDNIRDCFNGEDEEDCKFCEYDQFRCVADGSCISEKWYCDGFSDCIDGSDETNCDLSSDEEDDDKLFSYYDDNSHYDDYEDDSFLLEESATEADHNDSDGDKIVSTGDGVKPIFVNPNVTITAVASSSSSSSTSTTVKIPKRFRSTMMRNFKQQPTTSTTTTETPTTTSTTTTEYPTKVRNNSTETQQQSENTKASSSHLSPCPEFELRCVDGLCITLDQICDKVQDCTDNADELHCEY